MGAHDPKVIAVLEAELGRRAGGGIDPTSDQLRGLLALEPPGPMQFVNLLRYREDAAYPEGHGLAGAGLSGAEAYGRYGIRALEHVTRRGGRLVLYNDVDLVVIGADDGWDQVAIMEYPDVAAFVDMVSDPDYVDGLVDRDAGLERTVVLVTRPLLPGT